MPTTCDYCLEPVDDHDRRKRLSHVHLARELREASAQKTKMPQSWKRYGA